MASSGDPATVNALKSIAKAVEDQNRILKDLNRNVLAISKLLGRDVAQENLEAYTMASQHPISLEDLDGN